MNKKTVTITIRIDEKTRNEFNNVAEKLDIPVARILRDLIREYVIKNG